jgi:predicted DNA-binding ribbon-helix-helix protein
MQSTVVKRSGAIAGHKTSVSLEDAFWRGLKEIAKNCRTALPDLVDKIDAAREHSNLSSAIRCSCSIISGARNCDEDRYEPQARSSH